MPGKSYNVLFLCTGNSARSVLAEAILKHEGRGKFNAYSAGSHPKGIVHPQTIRVLENLGYATSQFHSKSWDEFAEANAPKMDFVFTVCGNAAGETCPVWIGHPMTAHWGVADPAAVTGNDAEISHAFNEAYRQLRNRIIAFASLPIASLDQLSLKKQLDEIGDTRD
jgi:arsenate reductase (thioredoxin)